MVTKTVTGSALQANWGTFASVGAGAEFGDPCLVCYTGTWTTDVGLGKEPLMKIDRTAFKEEAEIDEEPMDSAHADL